jgi:hypothetical protein
MNQKYLYLCGLLIPVMYIFMYILGGALRPGYNHIADSVSELLAPGAPNKPVLFVVQITYALLHILFGIGVLKFIHGTEHNVLTGRIGAWAIIGVGVATIGTAIFPQDAVGTQATTAGGIHKILVFGFLIPLSFLSTLVIGIWTQLADIFPGFAIYSYITVGLIIISGILGGSTVETPYAGLVERISAIIVHQWLFILAVKLLFT